jgi:hypothetical protein
MKRALAVMSPSPRGGVGGGVGVRYTNEATVPPHPRLRRDLSPSGRGEDGTVI